MKKQKKSEINAFYEMYKIEKGEKMFYKFKCKNCGKVEEKEIAIKDYDREKENQTCTCGGKMDRVIEWSGIAEGSGAGWFGARGGNII
jgi:predicted nucleic acid-binding Zn ribbon protein